MLFVELNPKSNYYVSRSLRQGCKLGVLGYARAGENAALRYSISSAAR